MTKQEKKRLSSVLRATEYLFLENIALKLVLEHRKVSNWQKLVEHLLADKEMLAGVRLKFRDVYNEIEGSADPSGALATLLGELPAWKKPHYHEKSMGITEAMSQARAICSPWLARHRGTKAA